MGRVLAGMVVSRLVRTACLLMVLAAPLAGAQNNQRSQLTVAPALSFFAPTIADYNRGYICVGSAVVTSTIAKGSTATDAIYVRSAATAISSTPVPTYTLPVSDLQFTTSPAGCTAASAWTSVPDASSPPAQVFTGDTPFTVTMYFRLLLSWTTDRGGVTYAIPDIRFWDNLPSANPP